MKKLITLLLIIASFSLSAQTNYTNMVGTLQSKDTTGGKNVRFNGATIGRIPFVTTPVLKDSLKNYARLGDRLVSGGVVTPNGDSLTVASGVVNINNVNYSFASRVLADIPPSATGLTRTFIIYAGTSGTLDSISGSQSANPVNPILPANTFGFISVPINDAGLGVPKDISNNFAKLNESNTFTSTQEINVSTGTPLMVIGLNGYMLIDNVGSGESYYNANAFHEFQISETPKFQIFNGSVNIPSGSTYNINGVPISSTPDTTIYRLVANSYSLATGQAKLTDVNFGRFMDDSLSIKLTPSAGDAILARDFITNEAIEIDYSDFEQPLTFGYGLTRASNTIVADTTSGAGLVSKTRLTGALASKENPLTFTTPLSRSVNTISIGDATTSLKGIASFNSTNFSVASGAVNTIQNINTTATPQFARVGLGSAASASTNLLLPAGTTSISSFRIPNGVAPTTPVSGDFWSLTTGLRTQTFDGTQTKDVIFDKVNNVFAGFGVGAIITDNLGNLSVAPAADRTTSNRITKTANYTVTLSDFGANGELILEVNATSGAVTITLPSLVNMSGVKLMVWKTDSSGNAVTISGAVNINGSSTASLAAQWNSLAITGGSTVYLSR